MAKSQETFLKKQREKDRAQKRKMKIQKRETKKEGTEKGLEIDWSSAPENKTLTEAERERLEVNKKQNTNK